MAEALEAAAKIKDPEVRTRTIEQLQRNASR